MEQSTDLQQENTNCRVEHVEHKCRLGFWGFPLQQADMFMFYFFMEPHFVDQIHIPIPVYQKCIYP